MSVSKKNIFLQFFIFLFFAFTILLFSSTTVEAQVLKPGQKFEEKKGGEKPTQKLPQVQSPADSTQTAAQDSTQQQQTNEIPDSISYGQYGLVYFAERLESTPPTRPPARYTRRGDASL